MDNLYWVGTRQSDIDNLKNFFLGSITIYGNNRNGNIAFCENSEQRINHNYVDENCEKFIVRVLKKICSNDKNAKFMFYDPIFAYQYGDLIRSRTICLNSLRLLEMFSNKLRSRAVVRNIIKTIPHTVLKGSDCTIDNFCSCFIGNNEFIIQKAISCGGEGTIHIKSAIDLKDISPNQNYIVSPYINGISLNVHIIIANNDICFFPPSVQIITEIKNKCLYSGADYICYKMLSPKIKSMIKTKSIELGKMAKSKGYRGVLGIDYLLADNELYFIEFNPRFQASSHLINKVLIKEFNLSLQQLNMNAFDNQDISKIEDFEVNYSNFSYTNTNISINRLRRIVSSKEKTQVQSDGYNPNCVYPKQPNVYLNRFIFNQNICSINNQSLILHPNIYVENIKSLLQKKDKHYKEYIKFSLLNHGLTLSESAIQLIRTKGILKNAVFDALDTIIFDNIYVNVPYKCKFVSFSPFVVIASNNELELWFDDIFISKIYIETVQKSIMRKKTISGIPYDSIINVSTDRVRINPAPICYFKRNNKACKFCNLPTQNYDYSFFEIREVIDYCIDNVKFRHFLIGGGTYSITNDSWELIIRITKYIRSKCDKEIYLMSIPPERTAILDELKGSGVNEIAFNLEMFDRNKAKKYMPGKGRISIGTYIESLKYAISLWGNTGKIRSLLIYGIDTDEVFLNGVEELCKLGVEPIISVFRPLKNTELADWNPPSTESIICIYKKCKEIAERYSLKLGPDCSKCQNNTLSFTF